MKSADDQSTKEININKRKIQRLQKNLTHWRTKQANNVRECEERNKALKEVDVDATHRAHGSRKKRPLRSTFNS